MLNVSRRNFHKTSDFIVHNISQSKALKTDLEHFQIQYNFRLLFLSRRSSIYLLEKFVESFPFSSLFLNFPEERDAALIGGTHLKRRTILFHDTNEVILADCSKLL